MYDIHIVFVYIFFLLFWKNQLRDWHEMFCIWFVSEWNIFWKSFLKNCRSAASEVVAPLIISIFFLFILFPSRYFVARFSKPVVLFHTHADAYYVVVSQSAASGNGASDFLGRTIRNCHSIARCAHQITTTCGVFNVERGKPVSYIMNKHKNFFHIDYVCMRHGHWN